MSIEYFFSDTSDGNLAFHVGDNEQLVKENRENLAKKYSFSNKKLVYMNQTHGCNVVVVDKNSPNLIDNCDAIITKEKNLPIMVMVADCIPILLFDKNKEIVAAIHAGRNSTFLEIAKKTAKVLIDEFSCETKDIKAILGPSIQKCCYEVSLELIDIVKTSFGERFVKNRNIDLQGINKMQLESLNIKDIEILQVCTKCSNKPYFSYRKDKKCGRFAGVIFIK